MRKLYSILLLLIFIFNFSQSTNIISPVDPVDPYPDPILTPTVPTTSIFHDTQGNVDVNASGQVQYTLPIALPPGIKSVAPQMNLMYVGGSGNGLPGFSWSLSGINSISRMGKTIEKDGIVQGINLDYNDFYQFNGQRLIVKNSVDAINYGKDKIEYITDVYSNAKFTSLGALAGQQYQGPNSFQANFEDGSIAVFGGTPESVSPLEYKITLWKDINGNTIKYKYRKENNVSLIESIEWGGNDKFLKPHFNKINFLYENRNVQEIYYVAGVELKQKLILKSVEVFSNNTLFKKYVIDYNTTNRYQFVKSIQEFNSQLEPANPVSFSYNQSQSSLEVTEGNNFDDLKKVVASGDFDGDGNMDLLVSNGNFHKMILNRFNGQQTIDTTIPYFGGNDIFTVSTLDNSGKMHSGQGIAFVSKSGKIDVYLLRGTQTVLEYSKTIPTPLSQCSYSSVGESCTRTLFLKESDFNGDGLSELYFSTTREECEWVYTGGDSSYKIQGKTKKKDNNVNPSIVAPGTELFCNPEVFEGAYVVDLNPTLSNNLSWESVNNAFDWGNEAYNYAFDFDGDNKTDILSRDNSTGKNTLYEVKDLGTSRTLVKKFEYTDANLNTKGILFGDFNGDGKTDILTPVAEGSSDWNIYLSTGKSFAKTALPGLMYYKPSENYQNGVWDGAIKGEYRMFSAYQSYFIQDINKDGKSDLLMFGSQVWQPDWYDAKNLDSSFGIQYRLSGGINTSGSFYFQNKIQIPTSYGPGYDEFYYSMYGDHFNAFASNFRIQSLNTNGIIVYKGGRLMKFGLEPDINKFAQLQSVTQGKITTSFEYKELNNDTNFYNGSNNLNYPFTEFTKVPGSFVVSRLKQGNLVQDFLYRGFVAHSYGKGVLGFRQIARTNMYGGLLQKIWSGKEIDTLLDGAPIKEWSTLDETQVFSSNISETNTALISYKKINYNPISFSNRAKVLLPSNTLEKDFISNTTKTSSITYNSNYLPQNIVNDVDNGYLTTSSTIQYFTPNTAVSDENYNVGRIQSVEDRITKYKNTTTNLLSKYETYSYVSNRLNKTKTFDRNQNEFVEETLGYDNWGNVISKTIAGSTGESVSNSVLFDSQGKFVIKKTDELGLITQNTYNNWGQLTYSMDPYGKTITNVYDGWGKLMSSQSNLSGITNYTYTKYTNGEHTVKESQPDGDETINYFDVRGRNYKTESKAFNQDTYVAVTKEYDDWDRELRVSEPYFTTDSPTKWNTYQYDVFSRATRVTSYAGKIATNNFSTVRKVETNENSGKFIKKEFDALGNIIKYEDNGGIIQYTYNAYGEVIKNTYQGNIIDVTYDNWGRKASLNDPSNGLYTYTYSVLGKVLKEDNPNGEKLYSYYLNNLLKDVTEKTDNLPISKVSNYQYTKGLLTWKYGTNNNSVSFDQRITYDTYGRPTSSTEQFDGKTFFKNNIVYDNLSRLKSYKQGITSNGITTAANVENVYKSWNGELYLQKELGTGKILWELQNVNAKGQILSEKLGAVNVNNTYNNSNGFLTKARHASATQVMLDNDYDFNAVFNKLNSRRNNVFGFTENFTYDDAHNRLVSWTNPKTMTISSNGYDNLGRITTNDQLGNVTYNTSGSIYRPASITLNANGVNNYDLNGSSKLIQKITYNENNDPIKIDGTRGDYAFDYGLTESRQIMYYGGNFTINSSARYVKHYSEDGSSEIIRDTQTGKEKHILYIGGSPYEAEIVYLKDYNESSGSFKFLHKDYLGSILAISNEAGGVVERRHFDAWGILTHGTMAFLDRGYTSHEHLADVELIHMNGRLYDPLLRRMLNADEVTHDGTIGLNKYAYAFNNPLMYADPNGEEPISFAAAAVFVIKIFAVATFSYVVGSIVANTPMSWGGWAKSVLVTAISAGVSFGIGELGAQMVKEGVSTASVVAFKMMAHGVTQTVISAFNGGGNPGATFAAAAIASLVGGMTEKGEDGMFFKDNINPLHTNVGRVLLGMASAGLASKLAGGNFWEGAGTGLVVNLFNDLANHLENKNIYNNSIKQNQQQKEPWDLDGDGRISLDEANNWYRNGHGQPITLDASKIDLNSVDTKGWVKGKTYGVQTLFNSKEGRVLGNIRVEYLDNNQVKILSDTYNFEMHENPLTVRSKPWTMIRNTATFLGILKSGSGMQYDINFRGINTIKHK